MTVKEEDLAECRVRAQAARTEFRTALFGAKGRLSPSRLREDATIAATQRFDQATGTLRDTARSHPAILASAAAGGLAFLFRRPLVRLTRRAAAATAEAWREHMSKRRAADGERHVQDDRQGP